MRTATIRRKTKETNVQVTLELDGTGQYEIETGVGFLDHMLAHVAVHGLFDLEVQASGDLHVDPHHTVEDVALVLGKAFDEALGDRAGLVRAGSAYMPMDASLAFVAVDLSGRPYGVTEMPWTGPTVGGIPTTLIPHFFESFAVTSRATHHAPSSADGTTITRRRRCSRRWAGRWTRRPGSTRGEVKSFRRRRERCEQEVDDDPDRRLQGREPDLGRAGAGLFGHSQPVGPIRG
jgi:imidazoleglycerol-phosphate dehydratase